MSDTVIIWIVIALFGTGVGIAYLVRRNEVGGKAAARDILRVVAISAVVVIAWYGLSRLWPGFWISHPGATVKLLMALVCWTFIVFLLHRKRQAGAVLLDIGRSTMQKINLFIGVVIAAASIVSMMGGIFDHHVKTGLNNFSQNVFILSFGAYFLFLGLIHFGIGEYGIYYLDRCEKWERLHSYKWEGRNGCTLTLILKRESPVFQTLSLRVPSAQKATVESLLAKHIQGGRTSI